MAGNLEWSTIASGFIPDFGLLSEPADKFEASLNALKDDSARDYWNETILNSQRDRMVAAAATAVGIIQHLAVGVASGNADNCRHLGGSTPIPIALKINTRA